MNYIITNEKKLENVFQEIKQALNTNSTKMINLSYDFFTRPKTKSQLGFFFGGLVKAINRHFFEIYGKKYDTEVIKEMLYNECGIKEELICPNGKIIQEHKRISRMSIQEMSEFIEKTIDFCDEYGIILQPELRYLWIYNLNPKTIEETKDLKFSERDSEYLNYVRKETCLICGKNNVEAHHVKLLEIGGLGNKTPDYMAIPLCDNCHRNMYGGHINTETIINACPFIFEHIDIKTFCKLRYKRWLSHKDIL